MTSSIQYYKFLISGIHISLLDIVPYYFGGILKSVAMDHIICTVRGSLKKLMTSLLDLFRDKRYLRNQINFSFRQTLILMYLFTLE